MYNTDTVKLLIQAPGFYENKWPRTPACNKTS